MPSEATVGPVPIRPEIAALAAYRPGGAAPGPNAVKLSSNENPFPPLPSVTAAIAESAARLPLYPDNAATRLTTEVAAWLDVPAERLSFGAGSVSVLMHLLSAISGPGDEIVFPWRSFEAYPLAVNVPGATPVQVPLLPDGRHDLDAMRAAVTERTRAVLVCTPNNPTGPCITHDELTDLLAQLPERTMLVVDEAYIEFTTDPEVARPLELLDDPRVAVLRTFSKAWGLAGFRIGYGITHPTLAGAIRTVTPPFSVSIPAQAAALATLAERETLLAQVAEIVSERDRMVGRLRELGFDVPDSQGNFVWLPAAEQTDRWAAHFAEHDLIVRAYAPDGVRITVSTPEINDRVLDAAAGLR